MSSAGGADVTTGHGGPILWRSVKDTFTFDSDGSCAVSSKPNENFDIFLVIVAEWSRTRFRGGFDRRIALFRSIRLDTVIKIVGDPSPNHFAFYAASLLLPSNLPRLISAVVFR